MQAVDDVVMEVEGEEPDKVEVEVAVEGEVVVEEEVVVQEEEVVVVEEVVVLVEEDVVEEPDDEPEPVTPEPEQESYFSLGDFDVDEMWDLAHAHFLAAKESSVDLFESVSDKLMTVGANVGDRALAIGNRASTFVGTARSQAEDFFSTSHPGIAGNAKLAAGGAAAALFFLGVTLASYRLVRRASVRIKRKMSTPAQAGHPAVGAAEPKYTKSVPVSVAAPEAPAVPTVMSNDSPGKTFAESLSPVQEDFCEKLWTEWNGSLVGHNTTQIVKRISKDDLPGVSPALVKRYFTMKKVKEVTVVDEPVKPAPKRKASVQEPTSAKKAAKVALQGADPGTGKSPAGKAGAKRRRSASAIQEARAAAMGEVAKHAQERVQMLAEPTGEIGKKKVRRASVAK
jgi:pyruvate/2-oxoglutarate dehydrogenase complex dihydrolipoamide acyltransferase (E2) component